MTDTSRGAIAERVASSSGSILTWVFALLLLASGLLPLTAVSAHHHAQSSSTVDVSGDAVLPGLRTFIHAGLRANVRPSRLEAAPGSDNGFIFVDCHVRAYPIGILRLLDLADDPSWQISALLFLARAPPVSA